MDPGETTLQLIGRLLIAFLFLGTLATNATMKFEQHRSRMEAYGIPLPAAALSFGFLMQGVGGLMLAFDWQRQIGCAILIAFLVLATAIFHRWWTVTDDPLRRHFHVSFVFANIGLIGALLYLMG
jgi:putative oxidoreductase